jgi:ParB-like chromosome segregation protein Spo0J
MGDTVAVSKLKANPTNPRVLRDEKFLKLKKSLTDFPDMLNKRPIVAVTDTDGKLMVLGGNMRLRACQDLGMKEVPVILADEWTEEQRREFIIKDNVGFGEWDWDNLANEWDAEQLADWGLDLPKEPLPSDEGQEDYMPGFRLVIECTSEAQQQQYFKEITNLGIECKPLTL